MTPINTNPVYSKTVNLSKKLVEVCKNMFVYGIGSVAQSAVTLLLLPVLTSKLTGENFGVYSLLVMLSAAASAIFYLGMTSALPRSYYDYDDFEVRRSVYTTSFIILMVGAGLQIFFGYLLGDYLSLALTNTASYGPAVFWSLVSAALTFINAYFLAYLRLVRKAKASVVFSILNLVVSILFAVELISVFPDDVAVPFQAISLAQIPIFFLFIILFRKEAFSKKIKWDEIPLLLPFGIASAVGSFGCILVDWTDRIILNHYMTLSEVGEYSAAFRLGLIINILFILPFAQIWTPMIMEYKNHKDIKEFFSKILLYFILVGSALILYVAVFAIDLVPLVIKLNISSEFYYVMMLTMFGALIYGTSNIVMAGMQYARRLTWMVYIYYGAAVIKGLLNLVFIPFFGLLGAAVVSFTVSILLPLSIGSVSKKYFSFKIFWKEILILLVLAGFGVYLALEMNFGSYLSWPQKMLFCSVFTALAVWFVLKREDIALLRSVFVDIIEDKKGK